MRPYSEKLTELLQNLSATLDSDSGSSFAQQREVNKVLVVAITSNRGLAGAFNSNIIKASKALKEKTYAGKQVDFVTIGKKGNDIISKDSNVIEFNATIFDDLNFKSSSDLAQMLMDKFTKGAYDKIVLVYNHFKNAATQIVMQEQFLPILPPEQTDTTNTVDYIFEPTKPEIVEGLIPKSLKTQLFKAIRDSVASEHGARMTAMHKATDNATELRDALKLQYNKARQAAITNEILEIVGGAEALAG